MLILSIDTFDVVTGVAVIRNGELLAERNLTRGKKRDAVLTAMVEGILQDCSITFDDLDCLAISSGPGSFTGLRVGAAYAKGICFALDKPLVTVGSLEALANTAGFTDRLIIPVVHARGKEVYYAAYKYKDSELTRIWDSDLCTADELSEKIGCPAVLIGSGCRKHREDLTSDPELIKIPLLYPESTAGFIGLLGTEKFKNGMLVNLERFEPEYLQDFPRRF